jgi:DNA-binding CsgD family transcriptional regulator
MRRAGQRARCREVLGEALDEARRFGAWRIRWLVHEELKLAGARPRRLAFSGVESLTAGQLRVARMAADGMTNREIAQALFVTPRTVEQHLYNAYKKLGIRSRSELATVVGG